MVFPIGIELDRKGRFTIGKIIGVGAQGSVHEILENKKATAFVAKVAKLPAKITKKKNSPAEINAQSIYMESVLYQNAFADLRGKVLPELPPIDGPPVYGHEHQGTRFLTIQRMENLLFDNIPALVDSRSNNTIDLTPIAVRLVDIVETMHERKHMLVDVKPDNFMLVKKSATPQNIAKNLRLVDLGLLAPWVGPHGKNENVGVSTLQGTPLYSSLNMHGLQSCSRRDDIEGIVYVITELAIRALAYSRGETAKYEASKQIPSYLPWSQEKSDEAVGRVKKEQVQNKKSIFYQLMSDKVAQKLYKVLEQCWRYEFSDKPDYQLIKNMLKDLKIDLPAKTTTGRRVIPSIQNESPVKRKRRTNSRSSIEQEESLAKQTKRDNSDCNMEVDEVDDPEEPSTMEVDLIEVQGKREGIMLEVVGGPHKGESISLLKGLRDIVIVGTCPSVNNKEYAVSLSKDTTLSSSHVRLELQKAKTYYRINATDLKSSAGTFINGAKVPSGKSQVLFDSNRICIGSTTMVVRNFKEQDTVMVDIVDSSIVEALHTRVTRSRKTRSTRQSEIDESFLKTAKENVPQTILEQSSSVSDSVILRIITGVYKGKEMILKVGQHESLCIGSDPMPRKKAEALSLPEDKALLANHAILSLAVRKSKAGSSVRVTVEDLTKSKGMTYVDGKQIVGKSTVAFIGHKIKLGSTVFSVDVL